jgi:hypothetical protein
LIGPAPHVHDDVANCVAGALVLALAALPSLWEPERFLVAGAPTSLPKRCGCVFAVLVAGEHSDAGYAFFAATLSGPLTVMDWQYREHLTPGVLIDLPLRLTEFSDALHAPWRLYTSKALARELWSLGHGGHVEVADAVLDEDETLLRLSAAKWIEADKVKIAKPDSYAVTSLLEMREKNNPLKTALLVGIALALQPGLSLTKPRAA